MENVTAGTKGPEITTLRTRQNKIKRRRPVLKRRLEDGYRRIDQALDQGEDIGTWEAFWIRLLHEYESVCDETADERMAA